MPGLYMIRMSNRRAASGTDGARLKTRDSTMTLLQLGSSGLLDERSEVGSVVTLDDWAHKPTTRFQCRCSQIKDNEQFIPSHLILTDKFLYILRNTETEGQLVVKARRKLNCVMKIIKKAKMPDVVEIEYGSRGRDGIRITDTDKLHIPANADKVVTQITKILKPVHKASPSKSPS